MKKIKTSLIIFASIMFSIAAASAAAIEFQTIGKSVPEIEIKFQEEVYIIDAQFYGIFDPEGIGLNVSAVEDPFITYAPYVNIIDAKFTSDLFNKTFIFKPVQSLPKGVYVLQVDVEDIVGNENTILKYFENKEPIFSIDIANPRHGTATSTTFDIIIETRFPGPYVAQCKYALSTDPKFDFSFPGLSPLNSPNGTTHIKEGYTKSGLAGPDPLYVVCRDSLGRVNQRRFDLTIDTTPPNVGIVFEPPKIIEYVGGKIQVNLKALPDDPSICKYNYIENPVGTPIYEQLIPFTGFDVKNPKAFKKEHVQNIVLPANEQASYMFFVACENKAGMRSPIESKDLIVDLKAPMELTVINPPQYTNKTNTSIYLKTNKDSYCTYNNLQMSTNINLRAKDHKAEMGVLGEGRHTISFYCIGPAGSFGQLEYSFSIDTTPPSVPEVNGSFFTCYADRFSFTPPVIFSSADEQSGIKHYLYSIKSSSGLMISNNSISAGELKEVDAKGENITETGTYTLTAKAVNNVGIESKESTGIKITYDPDRIECKETDPPTVTASVEYIESRAEVTLLCQDESGCDNNSFYYGLSEAGKCSPTVKLPSPFKVTVLKTQSICYNVSDIYGNRATGSKQITITVSGSCNNGILDSGESDVDCGGSCPACELGKSCVVDFDCASGYCENGICSEATCSDGKLNGPVNNKESDVDCGGYCVFEGKACDVGKSCISNDDCASLFCNPNEKTCMESTCDDGFQGGDEEGVDCGRSCDAICGDMDGDGMPDDWEDEYGLDKNNPDDALLDNDNDDLINVEEYNRGTNPLNEDTDGDGYNDGVEVRKKTNPLDPTDYPISPIGTILMIAGLLLLLGGGGYLIYANQDKLKDLFKPKEARQAPGIRPVAPSDIAAQKRAEDERKRQAEMRRVQLEERRKKLQELSGKIKDRRERREKADREKREKLFGKFAPKREIEAVQKEEAETGAERPGGWISISALKERLAPKKEKAKEAEEFKKLTDIEKGEVDEKLDKIAAKYEKAGAGDEMFEKLEGYIEKETGKTEERLEELAKKKRAIKNARKKSK